MRLLTPLPQDDLHGTDAVAISGSYGVLQDVPPGIIEEIQRILSVFAGYQTSW